jgi:HemY protein
VIRGAIVILFVLAVIATAIALAGDPGHATVVWLNHRLDTTGAVTAVGIGFLSLLAVAFWRIVWWIAEAPRRSARARAETRRRQGQEMLTRGFLAIAAGEGAEARRCAQKAAELNDDSSALVRVLTAQSAEAAGDIPAAQAAYTAMLGFPEMRLVGHRGLMTLALSQGDREAAVKHAQDAYNLAKTARWAWRALFESKVQAGEWSQALELVEGGLKRKIVTPVSAERTRAALLAASAASLETATDPKARDQAIDAATRATKLGPAFAPGAVIAARLLAEAGKVGKAEDVIEAAWAAAPHPALWLAYRDLRTNETPPERAKRLQGLIDKNPDHRESRILRVEQAVLANDHAGVDAAIAALSSEPPSQRLCGLFARASWALGRPDDSRAWVAKSAGAPQEPDWSDLDPEGKAFNYSKDDWIRLVSAWSETGQLLHPRLERQERGLSDLPELPSRYETSAPFVSAPLVSGAVSDEGFVAPLPDDPGSFDDALAGPPPEPPNPAPRRAIRRRPGSKAGGKTVGNA